MNIRHIKNRSYMAPKGAIISNGTITEFSNYKAYVAGHLFEIKYTFIRKVGRARQTFVQYLIDGKEYQERPFVKFFVKVDNADQKKRYPEKFA